MFIAAVFALVLCVLAYCAGWMGGYNQGRLDERIVPSKEPSITLTGKDAEEWLSHQLKSPYRRTIVNGD